MPLAGRNPGAPGGWLLPLPQPPPLAAVEADVCPTAWISRGCMEHDQHHKAAVRHRQRTPHPKRQWPNCTTGPRTPTSQHSPFTAHTNRLHREANTSSVDSVPPNGPSPTAGAVAWRTPPPPCTSTALSKHGVGVEPRFLGILGTTVFVVPDVTWGLKTVYHTLPPDDVCFDVILSHS